MTDDGLRDYELWMRVGGDGKSIYHTLYIDLVFISLPELAPEHFTQKSSSRIFVEPSDFELSVL